MAVGRGGYLTRIEVRCRLLADEVGWILARVSSPGLQLQALDDELGGVDQLIKWHRFGPLFRQQQAGETVSHVVTASDFITVESYPVDTGHGRTLYDSDTHQWQIAPTRRHTAPLMPARI